MLAFENSEEKVNESRSFGVVSIHVKNGISRGIMFDGLRQFSEAKIARQLKLRQQMETENF